MSFWIIIMGLVFLCGLACAIYLISRVLKFELFKKIYLKRKWRGIAAALFAVLIPFLAVLWILGSLNAIITVIHLTGFWLICDAVRFLARKKRDYSGRPYYAGYCAIVLTIAYLACGWILAHNISPKQYELSTDKELSSLRVLQFADAHIGTTFDSRGFERAVAKMQTYNPDVVVITGDLVDSNTSVSEFEKCIALLKNLKTRYGIYYAFGNHDRTIAYSVGNSETRDSYMRRGEEEVIRLLTDNGITVLRDESVLVDDRFYIIGREDKSSPRASIAQLTQNLDLSKYMIVLDHQPCDYDAEAASGADLVLSGHTHGGQMLPLGPLVGLLGSNDLVYGHIGRNGTDFIVTSGISDWELKFKTGCKSEFVVIDIE